MVSESVEVPEGVILKGAKAGVAANGERANTDVTDETVFSQPIILNNNASVDGVVLNAKPVINEAGVVSIKNSKLFNISVPTSGDDHAARAVIVPTQWDEPLLLKLNNNYFGDNTGVYNVLELNTPLADGSQISGNYFTKAAGSHNIINIYAMDNYSNIKIEDNHFEKSASAARIGTKGEVRSASIDFNNNEYDTTDVPEWAGLITVQPYGKETTSMGGLTININNTVNNTDQKQLYVYYENSSNNPLDDVNRPIINIDGIKEDWTTHPNGNVIVA